MEDSKDGVAGSSSKPEPNTPKGISSPLDEKKVSTKSKPEALRKKRFLMECEERSDGSLSKCNLIPLTEEEVSKTHAEEQTNQVLPISEVNSVWSMTPCDKQKCPIPLSKYKKAIKKDQMAESAKDPK